MNPQQNEDYMALVALILVLFILMIFCVAILIVGFMNIKKILKSSILFYGLVGLLMLAKLITELYFAINLIMIVQGKTTQESKQQTLNAFEASNKNGMYVTDFVICSLFLILMKQFHTLQYEALLNEDSSLMKKLWLAVQLFVFAAFVVFICLYNFNILDFTQTTISVAILNAIPWILYIAINLHANITMTGAITEQQITTRLSKTNKRLFWFFFSRGLQAAYEIILITDIGNTPFVNVVLNLEKAKGQPIVILSCFAIYLFVILLTQMIPLIISVQSPTIQMMQFIEVGSIKESLLESNSSFMNLIQKTESEAQIQKEVDLKQFQTIDVLSVGQNGFGVVKKGKMRGRIVVLRTIDTELSKYLIEQIASEIQEMKKLQFEGLMPIKYSVLQPTFISFITQFYDMNLKKLIDSKNTLNQSIRLMYELTNVVSELHKINLPHGTLKVNNIYISGTHIKVADHGLLSLKKFMSITQGYSNKSIYTAPQLLSGRHQVVVKPTKEGDIYALGMIMFEVFSGITVYRNLPISEVQASFKQKQIRPKIPANLPTQLQNLIRNCWQQDPNQRPSIEQVVIVLREYRNKFN